MWFRDPNDGFYWLTNDEDRLRAEVPERFPATAPDREYAQEGDWTWDWFTALTHDGRLRANFRWVCNPEFGGIAVEAKVEFPKLVTAQTLADFFKADPKKSDTLRLDATTTISRSKDHTGFTLHVGGGRLLWWGANGNMMCYAQGTLTQQQFDALNKYLGKAWKLTPKDDVVGLQNENGEWILATQYIEFTSDGRVPNREVYEENYARPWIAGYAKIVSSVTKYLDSITPARVAEATAGMTRATHSIFTRCVGCQACDGSHLEIHMARKDLDSYLIYSAYDRFSPNNNPLQQTWTLIGSPTPDAVSEFKSYMHKFLLDNLRPKVNGMCFMPLNRRTNSNPWRFHGDNRLRIEDGIRLIAGGRGEEMPPREGELLAEENRPVPQIRDARVRLRAPEVRLGGVQLGVAEFRAAAAQFRAEVVPAPEPAAINPNLFEQEWEGEE